MNSYSEKTGMPKFTLVIFVFQFIAFQFYAYKHPEDASLIYFSGGIMILGLFIAMTRLNLELNATGIRYRFTPFPFKTIEWDQIASIEIKKVSTVEDFYGWGFRYSRKLGRGFITDTEYGMVIRKNNGKKITLSIKNQDKVTQYLKEAKNMKSLHLQLSLQ